MLPMGVTLQGFETAPPEIQDMMSKPIRDLGLKLEGSPLERFVVQLYKELDRKGIGKFHPRCYLSDEWVAPRGSLSSASRFTWRTRNCSSWNLR